MRNVALTAPALIMISETETGSDNPAGKVFDGDFRQRGDVIRAMVEGWNVAEPLTPVFGEDLAPPDVDLLQCFQTVGGEPRTDHVEPAKALATPNFELCRRIETDPRFSAETRLERRSDFFRIEIEGSFEQG